MVHVFLGVKQQGLGRLLWFPVFCVPRCHCQLTARSWKQRSLGPCFPSGHLRTRLEGEGSGTGLVLSECGEYSDGKEVSRGCLGAARYKPLPPGNPW